MDKIRYGKIKWVRHDGVGYLIPNDDPSITILLDKSVFQGDFKKLKNGIEVNFTSRHLMGREVATNVYLKRR